MKPMMKNTLALSLLTVMSVTAPLLAVDAFEMETTQSCDDCLILDQFQHITSRQQQHSRPHRTVEIKGRHRSRAFSPAEIIGEHLATPLGKSKNRHCSLTTASPLDFFDCMELSDVIEDARAMEYPM